MENIAHLARPFRDLNRKVINIPERNLQNSADINTTLVTTDIFSGGYIQILITKYLFLLLQH